MYIAYSNPTIKPSTDVTFCLYSFPEQEYLVSRAELFPVHFRISQSCFLVYQSYNLYPTRLLCQLSINFLCVYFSQPEEVDTGDVDRLI
jgi:hypothetical protein